MVKSRTTLIFAFVFIALSSFVLYDMGVLSERRKEKTAASAQILRDLDQFAEWIELIPGPKSGKSKIRIECREENKSCSLASNMKWEIVAPEKTDADSVNVGSVLATLQTGKVTSSIAVDANLEARDWRAEFGLKEPPLAIAIQFKGQGEPLRLEFGDALVVGADHYALSSRDPKMILAIPTYIVRTLDRDIFHWRNKQLFPAAAIDDLVSVRWKHHDVAVEIELRREGSDWYAVQPKKFRADAMLANGLANATVNWTARSLFNEPAKLGKEPWLKVEFELKDGKKQYVEIFPLQDKSKYVARSSERSWLAEINAGDVSRFARTPPEFRDARLLSQGEQGQVAKASLEFRGGAAGAKLEFEKSQGGWAGANDAAKKLSPAKIAAFFALMASPQVKGAVADDLAIAAPWKKSAQATVRFQNAKSELVREFSIYTDRKTFALADGEFPRELRKLSEKFAQSFPVSLEDFQEPKGGK